MMTETSRVGDGGDCAGGASGALRQEEAAGRQADDSAATRRPRDRRTRPPLRRAGHASRSRSRPSRLPSDPLSATDIDTINRNSPFQPVFFAYDRRTIDAAGQQALNGNAELMKKYPTWIITIEGHSDERGTAEYNLALGERRALAARNYLVSLGVPADRLRTVSYGKEFPFEPGHDEGSWAKNRRAHFVVTSK